MKDNQVIKETIDLMERMNKLNNVIVESSLNRLIGWIENNEIALITAYRGKKENIKNPNLTKQDDKNEGDSYSRKENRERNRELSATLLRLGYGVTKISGVYVENFGTPNERLADEESYLVVNKDNDVNFFNNIFKLSEYYNQDCFCYKAKNDDVAYNVGTNNADYPGYGNRERNGRFVIGVKNEFMSRLGNKGFAFTDNDNLNSFNTNHNDRKKERMNKRFENGMNEEFNLFSKYNNLTKQTIGNIADKIIELLK